jgi:hypothetical protein
LRALVNLNVDQAVTGLTAVRYDIVMGSSTVQSCGIQFLIVRRDVTGISGSC